MRTEHVRVSAGLPVWPKHAPIIIDFNLSLEAIYSLSPNRFRRQNHYNYVVLTANATARNFQFSQFQMILTGNFDEIKLK